MAQDVCLFMRLSLGESVHSSQPFWANQPPQTSMKKWFVSSFTAFNSLHRFISCHVHIVFIFLKDDPSLDFPGFSSGVRGRWRDPWRSVLVQIKAHGNQSSDAHGGQITKQWSGWFKTSTKRAIDKKTRLEWDHRALRGGRKQHPGEDGKTVPVK